MHPNLKNPSKLRTVHPNHEKLNKIIRQTHCIFLHRFGVMHPLLYIIEAKIIKVATITLISMMAMISKTKTFLRIQGFYSEKGDLQVAQPPHSL